MAFCSKCGSEIDPNSSFCGSCGTPAPGAETPAPATAAPTTPMAAAPPMPSSSPPGMPPTPPPTAGAPLYGPPAPMPMAGYPQPSKGGGGGKAVLFILLGLLVIGVFVVLLLGFAVGPKWFVGGNDVADAEKVVQGFFNAEQSGSGKATMALVDTASVKKMDQYASENGYDTAAEMLQEAFDYSFPEKDVKITGLKLQTTIKGDTATVTVVGGDATYTDYYGDKTTESYKDEDTVFSTVEFTVKKINGKWYLQPDLSNM